MQRGRLAPAPLHPGRRLDQGLSARIVPNAPALSSLGPAAKKSWLCAPLLAVSPPKAIAQRPSMTTRLPALSLS